MIPRPGPAQAVAEPPGAAARSGEAREKRERVRALFTAIAPRYDRFNRLASLGLDQGWRRRAVRAGEVAEEMRILDLCTGTGDLARLCGESVRQPALIVGMDFNWTMLREAVRKRPAGSPSGPARHGTALRWLQGDAQRLPFRPASFDRVFIGFSTRNLTDLRGAVLDIVRILKPQGRLIILETGYPANWLVRLGYRVFLATVARALGWVLTGRLWPFSYFARSVKTFLTPSEFTELIRGCGARVSYVPLSGGLASLYLAEPSDGRARP